MIIKKSSLSKIFEYIYVLFAILTSGCVFFTFEFRIQSIIVLFLTSLGCFFLSNNKKRLKGLTGAFILLAIMWISLALNIDDMSNSNIYDVVLISIALLSGVIFLNSVNFIIFRKVYVNIILIICIISIVCFYIQINHQDIIRTFFNIRNINGFMASAFHTWGTSYIFSRNSGPFWEPGAFQGYISLAIICCLDEEKIESNFVKMAIMSITLLTTLSTSGYILAIIFLVYVFLKILKNKNGKFNKISSALSIFVFAAISIAAIIYISSTGIISSKFSNDNLSYVIRMKDLTTGIKLILERPFFGFGIMNPSLIEKWSILSITASNSNGFLAILQYFGLFLGGFFIFVCLRGFLYSFKNLNWFFLFIVFMILHFSEPLLLYPVYLIIMLNNKEYIHENSMGLQRSIAFNS